MTIAAAKVIVCCPGRNFVTLKLTTDQGIRAIGDATLNGRELAVASYPLPITSARCWSGATCGASRTSGSTSTRVRTDTARHLELWVPNFGIQEYMGFPAPARDVFPHAWSFADGTMHPGEASGHGVDIDEALAAKYPVRARLPVGRPARGRHAVQLVNAASRTSARGR